MTVERIENGSELQLILHGQVDTQTSPVFEAEIRDLSPFGRLVVDFSDVPYVSSAGLRVLLLSRKALKERENLVLRGVNSDVLAVLDMTGFSDIMTVER